MKRLLVNIICVALLGVLCPGRQLPAQSIDALLMDANSCEDIEKVMFRAFPGYYDQKMIDSIGLLLEVKEVGCKLSPPIRFTKMLYQLETMAEPPNDWPDLDGMHFYQAAIEQLAGPRAMSLAAMFGIDYGFLDYTGQQYLLFLQRWAVDLIHAGRLSPEVQAFLTLFAKADRRIHRAFNKSPLRESSLGQQYHRLHQRRTLGRAVVVDMGWQQRQGLADSLQRVMGSRSSISFQVGWVRGIGSIHLFSRVDVSQRPAHPFWVQRSDTAFFSNRYSSSAWGFSYAHTLLRSGSRFYLRGEGGFGWERRYFVDEFETTEEEVTIPWRVAVFEKMGPHNSTNFLLRAGLDMRYFIGPTVALSAQLLYEHVPGRDVPYYQQGSSWLYGLQLAYYLRSRAPEGKAKLRRQVQGSSTL